MYPTYPPSRTHPLPHHRCQPALSRSDQLLRTRYIPLTGLMLLITYASTLGVGSGYTNKEPQAICCDASRLTLQIFGFANNKLFYS
jgi:hypothetical protein